MAVNDLSPGFVKLHLQAPLFEHILTVPVNPIYDSGTGTWTLVEKGGGTNPLWSTALNAYVTVIKALLPTVDTLTYAELYTKAVGAAPIFKDTFSYNVAGTSGSTASTATQETLSYRDGSGGRGKLVLLDGTDAPNQKFIGPSYGNAAKLAWVTYVVGNTSVIYSRNNDYPINVPKILTKTNDVLRRKYGIVV